MKSISLTALTLILSFVALNNVVLFSTKKYNYDIPAKPPSLENATPDAACDSVTIFVQQLRTFPPSCCFSLIIDNKLQNAITQIKLDISTATFKNIAVEVNSGWLVSQTPQMDILLSHNSGFIPVGGASPLTFCLMGGNNPDALNISFNYSALGTMGSCNVPVQVCSDPFPCDAAFSFNSISNCGNFLFTNQSTGPAPLTYSWNFGDPGSGSANTSTAQNPTHQFSKCGDFIVCLKTTGPGCLDSICKTVAYFDIIKPVITCPANLTLRCNTNTTPSSTGTATATDNCTPSNAIVITYSDVVSGILPCNGSIVRTWQAKDACGNISTCNQTILIQDNVPPTISCPASLTVNTNPGTCYYTGTLPSATAMDNCDQSLALTYSLLTTGSSILITPQTQFPKGVNTITVFARDDCGNQSANCNFTLTVVDNQPPVITCPGNMTVQGTFDSSGNCKAVVQNIAPVVTDNCPMSTVNYSLSGATVGQGVADASGAQFTGGVTVVTYIVTDMSGNKDTCSFSISVSCQDLWSCTCPNGAAGGQNLVVNGNFSGGNAAFTNDFIYFNPGGTGSNGNYSVLTSTQVPLANAQWACNDHTTGTGSFLVIDGASSTGNNVAWQQIIPGSAGGTFNFCFYANNLVVPSKNFDDPDLVIFFNGVQAMPGVILPESPDAWVPFNATWTGILPVTIEIRTLSGQVVGNDFALDDIQFSQCSDSLPCEAAFAFQSVGNCGNVQFTNQSIALPPLAFSWNFGDPNSGTSNNSTAQNPTHQFSGCGDFTVCLQITGAGCTDSICKTVSFFDTIKPVITCPANLTLDCNSNVTPASTGMATATDDCTPVNAIMISYSDVVTGIIPCNGSMVRTWQAKDACGNISTCNQTILIQDNVPPTIICPANLTVNTNPGACFYTGTLPSATATDNCDPSLDFTYSLLTASSSIIITPQTQFPKGTNSITVFARDDCGNQSANCNFTLTVVDNQPPTVTCPANVSVQGIYDTQGLCKAVINNLSPVVTDNCPMVNTTYTVTGATVASGNDDASGTNFMQGISTVTYTATDMGGNTTSCSFNVTVFCPKPKCDSISAFLVPFQALPYACTFQFHVINQATAVSKIQIDLLTAVFNSAGIISPFTPVISPANRLTITHPSGSIPLGNFHVADLGITSGSNPNTAVVKFFYNNGLSTCDTNIIFNCPVDTTCGFAPSCATNSISLNTGVDPNGQLLLPGSFDPNWTVIASPYTGLNLPRPAEVVTPFSSWALQPNATAPCSQWISVFQGADKGSGPRYTYSKCFCVCKDNSPITIQLSALADNEADFWLYDASGNIIANLLGVHPIGNNSSTPFTLPPDTSTTQVILNKGTYCIRAGVKNWTRVTGINVCGSITGPGLIRSDCCENKSYITGIKYEDTLCNGLAYSGQPKLSGWQIILCDATGNAIDTVTTDASGYYSFGPLNPGNYSVKEINKPGWTLSNPVNNLVQIALGTHEVEQANFGNCPPQVCDSISFWVETLHTIPPACCFRLHIDNKVKDKFTQIPLNLFSASFNSITVDNLNGWFTSQSNLSNINLTHSSGFIPVGSFTPISWCINNGSNPDTIKIKAEYLVGASTVSCDTSFVFFCPPQPDTACGRACLIDSISLSTGIDHSTGQFLAPGSPDPYWTVIQSPYPSYILPKPAYALATPSYWHDQPSAIMPCSRWINFSGGPYHYNSGIYEFTRCFCICRDGALVQIQLSAMADNGVVLTLCDSTGTTIANLLSNTSGSPFLKPPKDTTVQLILDKGRYCIKASVANYGHTYTGLNVCGSIKGTGLVKEICCEPSSIIGIKYIDTLCTGIPYTGNLQTLQGWQIVLCNQQGVAIDTVTTDQNGSYSFSPLLPGLYTVKELNQSGWTPSSPATGMASIFLSANQVSQVNFANCPPEVDSCCISKENFIQNVINAVQLSVVDSLCKAIINVQRLPPCDSMYLIDWGDGQIIYGPFSTGMWMHTYTQSGVYTIQIPIVEYDHTGTPCFDTLIKYTIEINCNCECGRYALNMIQNGIVAPVHCNDTLILGCPPLQALSFNGNFSCLGVDSCQTSSIQWTFTGPSVNLGGNTFPGNIQINIPGPLNPGYYTLNLSTVCGQQKCTCKVTLYQRPCMLTDSCSNYCSGVSWSQLNTSWIQDMVVYQGKLIVAGLFSTIGNPPVAANHIAAWDGINWTALAGGGFNNIVHDIEVHNGLLYAGGAFTLAGSAPVDKIASWNGSVWSPIPQGGINGPISNVDALLSTSSGLVVGGNFSSVGTTSLPANNIALLNSTGWSLLGGLNGPVFTLAMHNNNIVAGGRFGNSPGGLNNVGVWNGSFWDKLGLFGAVNITIAPPNSGDGVHALASFGNELIVAGQFLNANPSIPNTQHIAKWNGASWSSLGTGVNTGNGIYDLFVANNELLAGGQFTVIGSQASNLLAKWNGNNWSGFGHPSIGIVRSIIVYSPNKDSLCNLYTGGEVLFNQWKCSGVSIPDPPKSLSVTIYPNPAMDRVYVQFNEVIRDDVQIGIYSLLGNQILHQVISKSKAAGTKMILTGELATGTYLIKVATAEGSVVKKIIVNGVR